MSHIKFTSISVEGDEGTVRGVVEGLRQFFAAPNGAPALPAATEPLSIAPADTAPRRQIAAPAKKTRKYRRPAAAAAPDEGAAGGTGSASRVPALIQQLLAKGPATSEDMLAAAHRGGLKIEMRQLISAIYYQRQQGHIRRVKEDQGLTGGAGRWELAR